MKSLSLLFLFLFFTVKAQANCTAELVIDGVISPATVDTYERAAKRVEKSNCSSLLLLINTPGGSLQSTRLLVEKIVNSEKPVICLIYPSGGHAGSAGAIILQACHLAGAMQATNIGAATPVLGGGQEMAKDLRKKIINDTKSWLEGLTTLRDRNKKFGQDIVESAKAVSAKEALKLGAIDYLAATKFDFLAWAAEQKVTLKEKKNIPVQIGDLKTFDPGLRHEVLALVADPQTAYLLFMGSLGLLYFELTHPGMIAPGVVGSIGLVLSFVSLHKLEVAWGGVVLILLGLGLMAAEAFVASFGILGLGGGASFLVGSLFLFDPETSGGYQLPYSVILPTAIGLAFITFGIAYMAFSTRTVKKTGDLDELVGVEAEVSEVVSGTRGFVSVRGEIWKYKTKDLLENRETVKVVGYKGLTLKIKKIKES